MTSLSQHQSAAAPFLLPTHLDEHAIEGVKSYLMGRGLAEPSDTVTLGPAGQSNMNCVWRVRLPGRSLILKQARPWVEKYPTIAAPVNRAEVEARFYRLASGDPVLADRMPQLVDHDADAHLLILEDLAPSVSLEACYSGDASLNVSQIDDIAGWVTRLHLLRVSLSENEVLRNRSMRALNHAHMFDLPLRQEGPFDELLEKVTPGLAKVADALRADSDYVTRVTTLGYRYRDVDGSVLIHGDFFLGSLLRDSEGKVMIIDPEFSFGGDSEFDLGVFYAHLLLCDRNGTLGDRWLAQTVRAESHSTSLLYHYAGVEVMRRLIGVAQLPVRLSLEEKRELLNFSRGLMNR